MNEYADSIKEKLDFKDMLDRSDIKEQIIVMVDGGYESYNTFEHIEKK